MPWEAAFGLICLLDNRKLINLLYINGHWHISARRLLFATTRGWQMRAIVIVIALVVALGFAYIADIYWYGGSYTRMVIHSLDRRPRQ